MAADTLSERTERTEQEGQDSHEYGMLYEYLDFMTSLSWKKEEMPEVDLAEAEKILDADHFGLNKVKKSLEIIPVHRVSDVLEKTGLPVSDLSLNADEV